uniref:Uncharacterized protein n=1 Tax=Anguilla anguilla TaxID=7936 RepID=A0A0E9VUL5_ANGAN
MSTDLAYRFTRTQLKCKCKCPTSINQ